MKSVWAGIISLSAVFHPLADDTGTPRTPDARFRVSTDRKVEVTGSQAQLRYTAWPGVIENGPHTISCFMTTSAVAGVPKEQNDRLISRACEAWRLMCKNTFSSVRISARSEGTLAKPRKLSLPRTGTWHGDLDPADVDAFLVGCSPHPRDHAYTKGCYCATV